MSIKIQCRHAHDIGRPSTVCCNLGLGGGKPHYGFCIGCLLRDKLIGSGDVEAERARRESPKPKGQPFPAGLEPISGCCDPPASKDLHR